MNKCRTPIQTIVWTRLSSFDSKLTSFNPLIAGLLSRVASAITSEKIVVDPFF